MSGTGILAGCSTGILDCFGFPGLSRPIHLRQVLQGVHELAPRQWHGKRAAIPLVNLYGLINDRAEFRKNVLGVRSMTSAIKQLRATTDETPVPVRPLDQLHVFVTLAHRLDSSIADRTARS